MQTADFAKLSLEQSFNLLKDLLKDTTEEQYNFDPPGTANAAAKSHVHLISAVDFFLNGLVAGGAPAWGPFASANGLPGNPLEIWGHGAPIPLAPMLELQDQVTAAALENVAKLSNDDFDRIVKTPMFGDQSVAFLVQLACLHTNGHAGDIATVKGIQGAKGLPF